MPVPAHAASGSSHEAANLTTKAQRHGENQKSATEAWGHRENQKSATEAWRHEEATRAMIPPITRSRAIPRSPDLNTSVIVSEPEPLRACYQIYCEAAQGLLV